MPRYQWPQTSWVGGMSVDKIYGRADQFQYAEKVDTRINPHGITLAKASVKDSASVVVDLVKVFLEIEEYVLAFGDKGNVYKKKVNSGISAWSKVCTLTDGKEILGACIYNGYVYFANENALYRKTVALAIGGSWSQPTNLLTGSGGMPSDWGSDDCNQMPMVEAFNKLYIGTGAYVFELQDVSGSLIGDEDRIQIPSDQEIVGITFNGAVIKFYSRAYDSVRDCGGSSKCYMWNGVDNSYNNVVFWPGIQVQSVVSHQGQDYVIGTPLTKNSYLSEASLYISTGYQYRCFVPYLPYMSPNAYIMTVYQNVVAFGGKWGVMTYGARTKDYPASLNYEWPASPGVRNNIEIGAVHAQSGNLFQSWKDTNSGTVYGIDITNDSQSPWASGYLVSRIFSDDRLTQRKRLDYVDLAFRPINSGDNINIYLRKDLSTFDPLHRFDYTELFNFGTAIGSASAGRLSNDLTCRIDDITTIGAFAEFNALEMKIELTTSNSIPPTLLEARLVYEPIYD